MLLRTGKPAGSQFLTKEVENMKIQLEEWQREMLALVGMNIDAEQELSEGEAFELLDRVYDIEVRYAQDADSDLESREFAKQYAAIADTIRHQIPED